MWQCCSWEGSAVFKNINKCIVLHVILMRIHAKRDRRTSCVWWDVRWSNYANVCMRSNTLWCKVQRQYMLCFAEQHAKCCIVSFKAWIKGFEQLDFEWMMSLESQLKWSVAHFGRFQWWAVRYIIGIFPRAFIGAVRLINWSQTGEKVILWRGFCISTPPPPVADNCPANTRRWPNVGLMSTSDRHQTNIESTSSVFLKRSCLKTARQQTPEIGSMLS